MEGLLSFLLFAVFFYLMMRFGCGAHISQKAGGHIVGTSPAASLKKRVELSGSTWGEYDALTFTGIGLMGRKQVKARSSNMWSRSSEYLQLWADLHLLLGR